LPVDYPGLQLHEEVLVELADDIYTGEAHRELLARHVRVFLQQLGQRDQVFLIPPPHDNNPVKSHI
jgi:hypothetical protein